MAVRTLSAVQKDDNAFVEDAGKDVVDSQEEVAVREFDPKFMKKTTLKVCLTLLLVYVRCANVRSWT